MADFIDYRIYRGAFCEFGFVHGLNLIAVGRHFLQSRIISYVKSNYPKGLF